MAKKVEVIIEVSARHVHLSEAHMHKLFGNRHIPCIMKPLSQPGQYASCDTIAIKGPKGEIDDVRVLGPCREKTQVEISGTDARHLGIKPVIKLSSDHQGTPGLTLIGKKGRVHLDSGVIVAERHLHISDRKAKELGLEHGQRVKIDVNGVRDLIFESVPVRVNPNYRLSFHIDTDEANAAWVQSGDTGTLVRYKKRKKKK